MSEITEVKYKILYSGYNAEEEAKKSFSSEPKIGGVMTITVDPLDKRYLIAKWSFSVRNPQNFQSVASTEDEFTEIYDINDPEELLLMAEDTLYEVEDEVRALSKFNSFIFKSETFSFEKISEEKEPEPTPEEPPETDVDPEVENTTSFPMYVLEDGNVISIKRMGPQKQAIATKEGAITFEFAPFLNSAPNIDLANEAAVSLETVIVREIPPAAQPSPGPLTSYSFEGTVINVGEQAPLNGAKIEDSRGKTSTSDSEGKFIIEGDYYPTTPLKLTISLKDYGTETVTISKEDGGIRNDLNVFKLKTTKVSADDEILKNKGWNENQQQELYKEERKDFIKTKSKQLLQTIKVKLTPYIILELAKLGVPNPSLVLSTVEKMSDKEERQRLKQKAKDLKEEQEKKKAERKAAKEENETESDNTIV